MDVLRSTTSNKHPDEFHCYCYECIIHTALFDTGIHDWFYSSEFFGLPLALIDSSFLPSFIFFYSEDTW